MKPKSTRVRVLWCVLLAALAGSGALQADNNNPSFEACAGYAKADTAYEAALLQSMAANEAAEASLQRMGEADKQQVAAYEAVLQQAETVNAIEAVTQQIVAYEAQQLVAYEAVAQQLDASDAALDAAKRAWVAAYSASYDLDGWPRSDDQAVMVKLEEHRQRCREIYGL